jgi:hypothetical protein
VCGLDLKEARTGKEARVQSETQGSDRGGTRIKSTRRKCLVLYDIEGQNRSRKANAMCHLRFWREGGMQMNMLGRAGATKRGFLSKVQSSPCRHGQIRQQKRQNKPFTSIGFQATALKPFRSLSGQCPRPQKVPKTHSCRMVNVKQ